MAISVASAFKYVPLHRFINLFSRLGIFLYYYQYYRCNSFTSVVRQFPKEHRIFNESEMTSMIGDLITGKKRKKVSVNSLLLARGYSVDFAQYPWS